MVAERQKQKRGTTKHTKHTNEDRRQKKSEEE
jgi:hypothetical protein